MQSNKLNIVTRANKGTPLSYPELDGNFGELSKVIDDVVETNEAVAAVADDVADIKDPTDTAKGASLIPYDGTSVGAQILVSRTLADYVALRAYTGPATRVILTAGGIAGSFSFRSSYSLGEDGGTVIVGTDGRKWVREGVEHLNIRWYGAIGDGTTDDSTAIQAALNAANFRSGGVVYFPGGYRFRKSDLTPTLLMYSNTVMRGDGGESSVIFHDDRPTNPRKDMLTVVTGSNAPAFIDMCFDGTLQSFVNETNQSQCLIGADLTNVSVVGCTFKNMRYMSVAFTYVRGGIASGNKLRDCLRDGLRFTHSSEIKITRNDFLRVADDAVALHSVDSDSVVGGPIDFTNLRPGAANIVANNTFTLCQGITVLGAKMLTITGNIFRLSIRSPIRVSNTSTLPEGNGNVFGIEISSNQIWDTFLNYNTTTRDYAIKLEFRNRYSPSAPKFGVGAEVFSHAWDNNIDATGTTINVGAWAIKVYDNIIGRSLPTGVAVSTYSFGQILDRQGSVNPPGYYDPTTTSTWFDVKGISAIGPIRALGVCGNTLTGGGPDVTAIEISMDDTAGVREDCMIHNNTISDWPGIGIDLSATNMLSTLFSVRGNSIDLDPLFRHSGHNTDNTWVSNAATTAIKCGTAHLFGVANDNVFAHCGQIIDAPTRLSWGEDNAAIWQPNGGSGLDGSATNRGIRYVPSSIKMIHTIYDGDPTSATFKNITTQPQIQATAMPSSGVYVYGHVTRANTPTVAGTTPNKYIATGWMRLTTGSGHVLNTDWSEMRALTGT